MTNLEIETKQRQKLIVIAAGMAIIVVLLVGAIIMVACNKKNDHGITGIENGEFTVVGDEQKTEEPKVEESKTEEPKADSTTTINDDAKDSQTENLPATGATDLLPLALILGVLTTGATALAMNKREV